MRTDHPLNPLPGVRSLILYLSVDCNEILTHGKAVHWPRPRRCPRCSGRRLWGHGFVERYFDGVPRRIPLKRWRCPDCHAVHTVRPDRYWRRFLAEREAILASLRSKEQQERWLPQYSRQRQQYWWRGFRIQRQLLGTHSAPANLAELGYIAATHSFIYREVRILDDPPHPTFACTPSVRGP